MPSSDTVSQRPAIAVFDVGPDWPVETLVRATDTVHRLLDDATAYCPRPVIRLGDAISRRWLARSGNIHLDEIDRIAAHIRRPGAHYFNTSYEWGCSTATGPCPRDRTARLARVLDWPTRGLGRNVIAARVAGAAGSWITLTWPGYTGVLQAMAPGRFSGAVNQAPMDMPVGLMPIDWAINRRKVWRSPAPTPAHLMRRVFEEAESYAQARTWLATEEIAAPAIFTLSGTAADEACVIERKQTESRIIEGPAGAANAWQSEGWTGRNRGVENAWRHAIMADCPRTFCPDFSWLKQPVLNKLTRLAMVADAATGRLMAQGYEADGAATRVLELTEETGGVRAVA